MERWIKRTVRLGAGLIFTGEENPSVIPHRVSKPTVFREDKPYFRRTSPERAGVSSGRLFALLCALERERGCNVHTLLCMRGDRVILECAAPGYSTRLPRLAHSMAKTVVGMAVGLLVSEGRLTLDTPLCELFPEVAYRDRKFPLIRVRHLLTMQSGIRFCEPGSVTEEDWLSAYFSSSVAFTPGSEFSYNSMNSYILSLLVCRITGQSLCEYLEPRLFSPLGIDNYFWERDSSGAEKGGWGLYMSPESWAKLGRVILTGGKFMGERVLPESWVRQSISTRVATPPSVGDFDYGYQLWLGQGGEALFSGMLGQYVWLCPRNDILAVITSSNNEIFGSGPTARILSEYLSGDLSEGGFIGGRGDLIRAADCFFSSRSAVKPYRQPRGIGYLLGLRRPTPYPPSWSRIFGSFHFAPAGAVSLLPLFLRVIGNNLSHRLESLSFRKEGSRVLLDYTESGVLRTLPIGFSDFEYGEVDYCGDRYLVGLMGGERVTEEGSVIYRIRMIFPELPYERLLELERLEGGSVRLSMTESPDEGAFNGMMSGINNPALNLALELLSRRLGRGYMRERLREAFSPVLMGAEVDSPSYGEILDSERGRAVEDAGNRRFIKGLTDRFFHEKEKKEGKGGGIIGIIRRLAGKGES